jgi:phosphatidylglycerol:prolipoprotein diacylglycerol transferase
MGEFSVYTYGVLHYIAILVLSLVGARMLKKKGAEPAAAFDAGIFYPIAMFICAYVAYLLFHLDLSQGSFTEALSAAGGGLWGGLVFYIGILVLYARLRGFPVWSLLDILSPGLALCLGIGKLGCFFGGCCWGRPTHLFLGMVPHPESMGDASLGPLHPVPLYDCLWGLAILMILVFMIRKGTRQGVVFLWFIILYSLGRFMTEFLRLDYMAKIEVLGLYTSQLVELLSILMAFVLLLWIRIQRFDYTTETTYQAIQDKTLLEGSCLAPVSRRILALVVDLAVPGVCAALAIAGIGGSILISAAVLYWILICTALPRTPGQKMLGMKMVKRNRESVRFPERLVRFLCQPFTWLSLVGIFRPCVSFSGQAFHDMVSGSYMISVEKLTAKGGNVR